MKIRPVKLEEIELLGGIEQAAASIFPPGKLPDPNKQTPLPVLFEAIKAGSLLGASVNQQLVAFAFSHRYQNQLHLDEISVHPDYGRQGIGTTLLNAILENGKSSGLTSCTLTTFEDIPWNAPFYIKVGFKILSKNETPSHVQDILEDEQAQGLKGRVAMSIDLG